MPISNDIYYHLYEGTDERKKPPVVLIHGAGGTHLYWPFQMRRLPGYRVYAPDLPGHGRSGGSGLQTIRAYADTVLTWMDAINLPEAAFIGHSMGSSIVLSLALTYPERILGLGLIGSGVRLQVAPELIEATASPTTFYSAVETLAALSFAPQTDLALTQVATQRMAETRQSVLHSDLLASNEFDPGELVSSIQKPTLILVGEEDRITPVRLATFLKNAVMGSQLIVIPEAGHMVLIEQPQAVADACRTFLSQIPY